MENSCLSAFTPAAVHPFAGIELLERLHNTMMIGCGLFNGQAGPVQRIRFGLPEIAVFHPDFIGVQQQAQFPHRIGIELVTFGNKHHGTACILMGKDNALTELPALRLVMIHRLGKIDFESLRKTGIRPDGFDRHAG